MNTILIGSGLVLASIAVLGAVAYADLGPFKDGHDLEPCSTYVFDREAWNDTENPEGSGLIDRGDESPAQLEADQLVHCGILLGLTRREVLDKLGEPGAPRAHLLEAKWFSYRTGTALDTLLLEDKTLSISFGSRGHVRRVAHDA